MASVAFTPTLRDEYQRLFDTCQIRPERLQEVESLNKKITQNRNRYQAVGDPLGIPWYFIGVIHCLEASLNFNKHLHNGDPLTARTVQIPKGRPNYRLEAYNGFGYRAFHPEVLSPYLWSYSNHYTKGKYVADGTFSLTAVSKQCGVAALLRRMAEIGTLQFKPDGTPITGVGKDNTDGNALFDKFGPLIRFSKKERWRQFGSEFSTWRGVGKFAGRRTAARRRRVRARLFVVRLAIDSPCESIMLRAFAFHRRGAD